ncbi:MAG: sigma-70 family RNA polymerase sigma factor [Anaerostipes sp.]|nr:sigma-70 family RNA polymerase sigma factor [Anaerostipes sp.]
MKKETKDILFELFYNKTFEEIRNYLKVLYRWDADEAYDVLQDVYLIAYEKFDMLNKHPNPIGWMKVTARNKCWQSFTKKNRVDEFLADDNFFRWNGSFEDDYSSLLIEDLKKALTKEEYELFMEFVEKGYSTKELAKIKNVTDQAVRSKLSRIRKKARKQLFMFMMFG